MAKLPEALERLLNSEVLFPARSLSDPMPSSIQVGERTDRQDPVCVIGPGDEGTLHLTYHKSGTRQGEYHLEQLSTADPGVIRLSLIESTATVYMIHQRRETLPSDVDFEQVPMADVLRRFEELYPS